MDENQPMQGQPPQSQQPLPAEPQGGKKMTWLWVALVIVIVALVIWLVVQ